MEEWQINDWNEQINNQDLVAFYLYTPMCGTCAVATKMLDVIESLLPDLPIGKANINFHQQFALENQIESVPCLLIWRKDQRIEKLYAFQSVPHLYEKLKK